MIDDDNCLVNREISNHIKSQRDLHDEPEKESFTVVAYTQAY
jgi:hypothetical protein